MEQQKSAFVLTGFTHDVGFRVFAFDCIEDSRARTQYTVRADLTLARKCGVHIQDLPLLCRRFLDKLEDGRAPIVTLPEEEMVACAAKETLRNQSKGRKTWQRPAEPTEPSAEPSAAPEPAAAEPSNSRP
jgi:hypothetical protein